MSTGLHDSPRRSSRFSRARRARAPARSGARAVPQGAPVHDSRERRRVQYRGQPGGLLSLRTASLVGDGRLPDRRAGRGARARDGRRAASTRRFAHDGARGPNIATVYSDLGHGVRPPVVFYNRANEAAAHAQARRLRLGRASSPAASAGFTAAAFSRRCRTRRPRSIIEAHAGGPDARRRRVVRSQLSRKTLERDRRRDARARRSSRGSSSSSTCSSATRRTCRRASASRVPR